MRPIDLVAAAAVPVALVAYGLSLSAGAKDSISLAPRRRTGRRAEDVRPTVAWRTPSGAGSLDLDGAALLAPVLLAALPTAQNVYVYAVQYRTARTPGPQRRTAQHLDLDPGDDRRSAACSADLLHRGKASYGERRDLVDADAFVGGLRDHGQRVGAAVALGRQLARWTRRRSPDRPSSPGRAWPRVLDRLVDVDLAAQRDHHEQPLTVEIPVRLDGRLLAVVDPAQRLAASGPACS